MPVGLGKKRSGFFKLPLVELEFSFLNEMMRPDILLPLLYQITIGIVERKGSADLIEDYPVSLCHLRT